MIDLATVVARLYAKKIHCTHTLPSSNPISLLPPSQLDHDNPLHPGNMSSLIRLVSAALEKPQAPCGEGPEREASVAVGQTRRRTELQPTQGSVQQQPHLYTSLISQPTFDETTPIDDSPDGCIPIMSLQSLSLLKPLS